jgi:hypothetical protein
MSVTNLKVSGREYVLLPRKEYERLAADQQNRRAAFRARVALAKYRAGKLKTIPHETVKRILGM